MKCWKLLVYAVSRSIHAVVNSIKTSLNQKHFFLMRSKFVSYLHSLQTQTHTNTNTTTRTRVHTHTHLRARVCAYVRTHVIRKMVKKHLLAKRNEDLKDADKKKTMKVVANIVDG